jgi:outer membrane lipoprotein SlyB
MKDETKACILTGAWALGLLLGAMIGGGVGAVIALTATLLFVGVLYSSWLIEKTERRLSRYITHTGRAIEREHNRPNRRLK